MRILIRKLCLLIIMNLPLYSYGFVNVQSKEDAVNLSDEVVIVQKISGRIDCQSVRFKKKIDKESQCYKSNVSNDLLNFNTAREYEEFLVLRSFKGDKKYGDIIKVKYLDSVYGDTKLDIGGMYLIFFRKENKFYTYAFYNTVNYEKLESFLTEKTSLGDLVKALKNNPSVFWVPPDFYVE